MHARPAAIAVALLLVASLALSSWAGVIVLMPLQGRPGEVQPPIVFTSPADTQVNATIGPNGTSANITVNIPDTYVISLYSRAAVYWTDFNDTDPLVAGDLVPLNNDTCYWYWDSLNGTLVGVDNGTSASFGGECVLLVNRYIPTGRTIYVDVTFRWSNVVVLSPPANIIGIGRAYTYSDIVFLNKTTLNTTQDLYTTGNYIRWLLLGTDNFWTGSVATVYEYNTTNGWIELDYNTSVYYNTGYWYDLLGVRNNTSGVIAEYEGATELVNATSYNVSVDAVGLGLYVYAGTAVVEETVEYDELVVTIDRPPTYIQVYGVQPGWTVALYDSAGNLVASETATGYSVSLDVSNNKIVRNGTIAVYDSSGALVTENTFTWVVGGDIYFVSPAWEGAIYNVLNFQNNDTVTTYNAFLYLVSYNISVGGNVSELYMWIESGSQTSYAVAILNNTLVSRATTSIPVYPQYPGQIYLYWNATLGTDVNLTLIYVYYVNGTYVIYPVRVSVVS